ncbi:response regulator transcription factor [Sinorhizobium sp. 7-81]|uniref:helix-turn-helix transcriptional regulator n=1 Tax=Sinorhizobium sp. 8-89 TaxID=3049089 RepID=UPI0024C3ED84|nr:response regulator transcription factor [Sinorhizobium sp. 8-89]MDK1490742.1 response regulator transcription factor [Sinorhizobium sp. 8-89]
MYRTSSNVSDFEDNNKVLPKKNKIVMLAKVDLFAECLMQAVGARFPGEDIVSLSDPEGLLDGNLVDVSLVMLYRIPVTTFPSVLRMIHEFHPKASIGLVVEEADALDSSIAGFVDEGLIHGVLPLNLHLDVCLTVIDLLMKGGEHFPAALLRRLAPVGLAGGALGARREAAVEPFVVPEPKRDAHIGMLTTREVQILDLICMGTQNKIIADRLGLSENTVKVHVRNIYKKMNVRNRTEAASRYFTHEADLSEARPGSRWRN